MSKQQAITFPLRPAARRVFVDTSAFFVLVGPTNQQHAIGQAIMERLTNERWRLFTTNYIVAETHALVLTRLGRDIAAQTLRFLDAGAATIVRAAPLDERRAREIIYQYQDKEFSLTDGISFAVMERLHLTYAFTFDRDFPQYGFTVVTPTTP